MALTNGSLYGKLDGNHYGNVVNTPFNTCNETNPNYRQDTDLFQIVAPGQKVLLNVTSAGAVNLTPASPTKTTQVQTVQMTAQQYAWYKTQSASVANVMLATFPNNWNGTVGQKLDIFQIASTRQSGAGTTGGGAEVARLTYAGVWSTS